ncbi:hypothetical protein HZQ44_09790 [Elizabethkingia anophelis]|nr:hypothetical protein [Elizabethkingia anophelis]MCT3695478.1 hypothetical protein [Elizabethkingia anophelis]MCT3859442.1 hypothetical protein [Elizabethkingia anophelis]MCT3912747.1 hypothetical protein [Elizabethkingia anophelis]MCT4311774.1 hypothetical protein [Elizabethkingia anophelis]
MPSSWLPHSFYPKTRMLLSHFKSKGISVFLTHHKGQASLENNLHPLGSIFFQNLGAAKHEPFMLVKRNIAYSGSLNE